MSDERFSLRDSELNLPRADDEGRISASWVAVRKRLDPSPRHEIARVFFKDAILAASKIH